MRKTILILFLTVLSMNAIGQNLGDTVISNNKKNLKLKVLYFHITNRCNTCISIEANVKKTIETHFLNELELGIIDLYIINCELPENKELAVKYDAYGATFALTTYFNGKESKTEDISNWAFKKAHNQTLFISELKTKIEELIN